MDLVLDAKLISEKAEVLFQKIWNQYISLAPQAEQVKTLFEKTGESSINDHVAYRTLRHPKLGIQSIARHFEPLGYDYKGEYHFDEKKLFAIHLENQWDPTLPKIFISELKLEEFPEDLKKIFKTSLESFDSQLAYQEDFLTSGSLFEKSFKTYKELLKVSEYAAWFYVYGMCANHFTLLINSLKNFNEIKEVNLFLKENNFDLNDSGGEIKGTPDQFLEQSSTKAFQLDVDFLEGTYKVPSCYYEFAKRYPRGSSGDLFQGFITGSADKIFESTDVQD